jgi:hypothetical protein
MSQPTLSSIERGATRWVRMRTLIGLADGLEVDAKWLERGEDQVDRDHGTNEEEREVLALFRAMHPTHRAAWVAAGTAMLRAKTGGNGERDKTKKTDQSED